MGYIHSVSTGNQSYLIEPNLFAIAGGTSLALTAEIPNFTLFSGAYVHIKVGVVIANATLNVNNTGSIYIYYNNDPIGTDVLTDNHIYTFIYDGSYWNVVGDITGKDILIGTTAEWQSHSSYIAPAGTIIIYTDRGTYTSNNTTITVPGIKISDGLAYAIDLPFIGDDHINDSVKHITNTERTFWNNKLNCDINGEILIFNNS